jgi:serine/threonine protein kinase
MPDDDPISLTIRKSNAIHNLDQPGISTILADLGESLAKWDTGATDMTITIGDLSRGGANAYLPPEIKLPLPRPDLIVNYDRSDIWSLGVILLHIMNNTKVGSAIHDPKTRQVLPNLFPSNVSLPLQTLVIALLEYDPTKRLSCYDAVVAFKQLLDESLSLSLSSSLSQLAKASSMSDRPPLSVTNTFFIFIIRTNAYNNDYLLLLAFVSSFFMLFTHL